MTEFDGLTRLQQTIVAYKPEHNGLAPDGKVGVILERMADVMAKIESVSKDQQNDNLKFKFRGIDDIYNMIQKHLAEAKITTRLRMIGFDEVWGTTSSGKPQVRVLAAYVMDFMTTDGSMVTCGPVIGEALDTSDKVFNKTLSIADKYMLLTAFKIPTADEKDPDASGNDAHGRGGKKPEPKEEPKAQPKAATQPKPAPAHNPDPAPASAPAPPTDFEKPTAEQLNILRGFHKSGAMKAALGDERTSYVANDLKNGTMSKVEVETVINSIQAYNKTS